MCSSQLLSGFKSGEKKSSFHFQEDTDLNEKWIYFVDRKNWLPSKNSVICIDHFEKIFIKYGQKKCNLMWELKPVPTAHVDEISNSSVL